MIHDMKRGKAPGWDMTDPDLVLYGGEALCHVLTTIFNKNTDKESLPSHLNKVLWYQYKRAMVIVG